MSIKEQNFAKAEMLIRKPVADVFEAFVDPATTTKVWFTKSTGRLDENDAVEWTWEMYGHTVPIRVKSIDKDLRIVIEWGNYGETTEVEWNFRSLDAGSTFVSVTNRGFVGNDEKIVSQIRDSTEGFTILLAGMKAYLEHSVELNLVGDRFPRSN
ncbi:MAG TPA: SRPBCC family protein [Pyrinomonadaceae bacterium]|nr:SRPBCC family protein [Pyrinomonadaceae bacterium]